MGRADLKITADTNLLVRAAIGDDAKQAAIASELLNSATLVAIPVSALCEFVWVLRQVYRRPSSEVVDALRILLDTATVVTDFSAAQAGLAMLEAGGDFADGAIAHEGAMMGSEVFVSFDQAAVKRLAAQGQPAMLAGEL